MYCADWHKFVAWVAWFNRSFTSNLALQYISTDDTVRYWSTAALYAMKQCDNLRAISEHERPSKSPKIHPKNQRFFGDPGKGDFWKPLPTHPWVLYMTAWVGQTRLTIIWFLQPSQTSGVAPKRRLHSPLSHNGSTPRETHPAPHDMCSRHLQTPMSVRIKDEGWRMKDLLPLSV